MTGADVMRTARRYRPRAVPLLLAVTAAVLLTAGCSSTTAAHPTGSGSTATTRSGPSRTASGSGSGSVPANASGAACGDRTSPPVTRKITEPDGPWGHSIWIAHIDGLAITGAVKLADHASVPDGVRLDDGTTAIYFIDAETGGIARGVWDGTTFTRTGMISIDGQSPPISAVDPDVSLTADGGFRLTFFATFGPPTGAHAKDALMCTATSQDGTAFTTEQAIYTAPTTLTDPSLVTIGNVSVLAISDGPSTRIARSANSPGAYDFADVTTVASGGVPELERTDTGLRLYTCGRGGVVVSDSTDQGTTWNEIGTLTGLPTGTDAAVACDPSRVVGTDLFVFKTAPQRANQPAAPTK